MEAPEIRDRALSRAELADLAARLTLPRDQGGEELWVYPISVFPDRNRPGKWCKRPVTPHGHLDAVDRPARARELFMSVRGATHVGVPMGVKTMLLAVDVDVGPGLVFLQQHWRTFGNTLIHKSGSGGFHFIYQLPGPPCEILGNTAGKIARGIDTRGEGGALVWAGPRYWATNDVPPARLPAWMLKKLRAKPQEAVERSDYTLPADDRLRALLQFVEFSREGERNGRLFWAACRAGEMVRDGLISRDEAAGRLSDAGVAVGLGRRESLLTARSGLDSGIPTIGGPGFGRSRGS